MSNLGQSSFSSVTGDWDVTPDAHMGLVPSPWVLHKNSPCVIFKKLEQNTFRSFSKLKRRRNENQNCIEFLYSIGPSPLASITSANKDKRLETLSTWLVRMERHQLNNF